MYLEVVTLNGFKSFAKKSELEFSTPITAIVGPNGSGKSNVAEAFRFVLGEQSFKSMRGKKGEDLIFGGTDSATRSNRAEVVVTLNNPVIEGTKLFPVEFDKFNITRTVYRDGQNEYTLNGAKVRLRDIQEILATANIGSSGCHIISQGEADRILISGPLARREMIEDALGLKIYQFKRQGAERKLINTEDNITRVESLRQEAAPHLKFLTRQMKKVARSAGLREELKVFYAEYLKREDVYLTHHKQQLLDQKEEVETSLTDLESKINTTKAGLTTGNQVAEHKQLIETEEKMAALRNEFRQVAREGGQFEGQIALLKKRLEDKETNVQKSATVVIDRQSTKGLFDGLISRATVAKVSNSAEKLRLELDRIITDLKDFLNNIEASDEKTSPANEEMELTALIKAKTNLDSRLDELAARETKLNHQSNELRTVIESKASENLAAERILFKLMTEKRTTETELTNLERELTQLDREQAEFKNEVQTAERVIGQSALDYHNFTITDKSGQAITDTLILAEAREKQSHRLRNLEKIKIRLEEFGEVSEDLEKEYHEAKERDEFLERELTD